MTINVGEHAPCSLGWSEIKSKSRQKEGEARGKRVQRENRMEGGRNADFYCGFIGSPPLREVVPLLTGSRTTDSNIKNNIE